MQKFFSKTKRGFTIIETMIAISIFILVVMIGMDSLLNASVVHQKSQNMRSILDNLSFILEDMSRNLRVGYSYRCLSSFSSTNIEVPQSCASGRVLAFENSIGDPSSSADQWVYKIESTDGGVTYNISKSINSGGGLNPWVQLNPDEVDLKSASGFSVLGAEAFDPLDSNSDTGKPFVIIKLVGEINDTKNNVKTPFSLQTSISQRVLDF